MIQVMEQDNGVVKFDIGTFVLCHRKLCLLMQPLRKGYETFVYVTRLVKSAIAQGAEESYLTVFLVKFIVQL